MINEYNSIVKFRELIINQAEGRITLYLKMVSIILPVIAVFILQTDINDASQIIISIAVPLAVYIFGIIMFPHVIEGHISIVNYTRKLNKTRKFFY